MVPGYGQTESAGKLLRVLRSLHVYLPLAKGVRLDYLDSKYRQNASRAYAGIMKRFVKPDSDGQLTLTDTVYSAGLGGRPYRDGSYEYYIHEKVGANDPKGIGAFLLASSEIELSDRGESK